MITAVCISDPACVPRKQLAAPSPDGVDVTDDGNQLFEPVGKKRESGWQVFDNVRPSVKVCCQCSQKCVDECSSVT